MEFRDWRRPKSTSLAWLFVFAATVPGATVIVDLLHGRGLSWFSWGRASMTLGLSAGLVLFLALYLAQEKHAWNALESKLRREALVSEDLREQIAALRARVQKLEAAAASADDVTAEEGMAPGAPARAGDPMSTAGSAAPADPRSEP